MNPNLLRTQWHRLPDKIIRQLQAEKLRRALHDWRREITAQMPSANPDYMP